jgi:non-specific serine/threonine protein kinase
LRQVELADGQPWCFMLETVREYALERLTESGEEPAIRRRHILHYLALAEGAEAELSTGFRQPAWMARIEREHDNLRAAFAWCVERGYAEPAFRLAEALWWFWAVHGHVGEGREQLAGLLARFPLRDDARKHAARYAQALRAAGMLASAQGDHAAARALQEEGLDLRRRLGDPAGIYHALEGLGLVANQQGDHRAARAFFEEALVIARALDNAEMVAWSSYNLGIVMHAWGDHAAARALLEESLALQSEHRLGSRPGIVGAAALHSLAVVAHDLAEHDLARRLAEEGIGILRQHGYRRNEADALATLGSVAAAQGDYSAAEGYLGASLTAHQELGNPAGIAYVLERHAGLAAARAQPARAIRLAAAAAALREQIGILLPPDAQDRIDGALQPARQALGRRASEDAWDAGRVLSPEEAIAEALSPAAPAPAVPAAPAGNGAADVLTRREREVAVLIARGRTNRQIATELFITEGTVANHVVHILSKLGYNARAQIAVWASERGLLATEAP